MAVIRNLNKKQYPMLFKIWNGGIMYQSLLSNGSQGSLNQTRHGFQTMSQRLKTGNRHIFPPCQSRYSSGLPDKNGERLMMQHEMQPGMQQKDMSMMEMWENLSEAQKKTLMKRMLDSKIMMKEGMIRHFQFKIETMKMIKSMLD
jgi:hypothetical protein